MVQNTSVIVFGASGNVGQYIVPALVKANVKTTVATRPVSKATFTEQVKVVTANYESLDNLTSIIRGHDVVVSLVTAKAVSSQKLLVDAAIAAGATYFIPSEFGHDPNNEAVVPLLPIFNAKREVAADLREKEAQGLSWTGLTTAMFFDWGFPFGSFDVNLKEATITIWDGGNTLFSAANMDDISDAVVRLITDSATTQNEILAAAEGVTGKKFAVKELNSEEAFVDPSAVFTVVKAIQLSGKGLSDYGRRVAEGHGKFLVNRKRDVKEVLASVLAT